MTEAQVINTKQQLCQYIVSFPQYRPTKVLVEIKNREFFILRLHLALSATATPVSTRLRCLIWEN